MGQMAPKVAAKARGKAAPKAKAMTKSGIIEALVASTELKKADVRKTLDALNGVATKGVKEAGKFTLPGLCMIKTRLKPATKAGKREVFGKVVMVKAKPASTVVKGYVVAALKKAVA